jgi:hypothetical protein
MKEKVVFNKDFNKILSMGSAPHVHSFISYPALAIIFTHTVDNGITLFFFYFFNLQNIYTVYKCSYRG